MPAAILFCQFRKPLDFMSSYALQLSTEIVAQWMSNLARWHLSQETRVVTKKEIVKAISEEMDLTQLKTKEIVQKTFDAIVDTLVREERIELRNFGVFEVKKRAARKARNPRTGDPVDVDAKYVVTFKPGKEMEKRVKELEERDAREAAARKNQAAGPAATPSGNAHPDHPAPQGVPSENAASESTDSQNSSSESTGSESPLNSPLPNSQPSTQYTS